MAADVASSRVLQEGKARQTDTQTRLRSAFSSLPCSHLRTLQTEAAAPRTLLHSVPYYKELSQHFRQFLFSPCLFVQPGAAALQPQLPAAQLGATERPLKSMSSISKLNSTLLVVAAVLGTDGPAGLQKL